MPGFNVFGILKQKKDEANETDSQNEEDVFDNSICDCDFDVQECCEENQKSFGKNALCGHLASDPFFLNSQHIGKKKSCDLDRCEIDTYCYDMKDEAMSHDIKPCSKKTNIIKTVCRSLQNGLSHYRDKIPTDNYMVCGFLRNVVCSLLLILFFTWAVVLLLSLFKKLK